MGESNRGRLARRRCEPAGTSSYMPDSTTGLTCEAFTCASAVVAPAAGSEPMDKTGDPDEYEPGAFPNIEP